MAIFVSAESSDLLDKCVSFVLILSLPQNDVCVYESMPFSVAQWLVCVACGAR